MSTEAGRVSFCVGTGRCGTTFIGELAALEPGVAASHERLRLPATFHMFCKWHEIPVDPEGFLIDRDAVVKEDLREHRVSFESSALLSHSIAELFERFERFERFDAKFLLLVRRPDATVASFSARGWFLDPIPWGDPSLPPTIPEGANPRHFFGRNLPRGGQFDRWSKLTQIGKLGWFWQARNRAILEQFRQLPSAHCRVLRLEDFDHQRYRDVAEFLGWQTEIPVDRFNELAGGRPNAGPNSPSDPRGWSPLEVVEFEAEVADVSGALGYEHRIAALLDGSNPVRDAASGGPKVSDVLARLDELE